jgi:hypothetical protein
MPAADELDASPWTAGGGPLPSRDGGSADSLWNTMVVARRHLATCTALSL